MENIVASQIWAWLLAAASAVVLLSNAVEKIAKAVHHAKVPNAKQDERIAELERWRKEVDAKLESDLHRLDNIEAGNRASHQALLALLDHGIDGNNIKQMQDAKETLQQHLINR